MKAIFGKRSLVAVLASTVLAVGTSAHATSVTHIYDLTAASGLNDQLGGPALVNNGAVLSASGLTFAANQGPSLSNGVNSTIYSIEMRFSLDTVSGYRKLIDFKDRSSDNGLYNRNSNLNFYPVATGLTAGFTPGGLVDVILTRDSAGLVNGYLNGALELSFSDNLNLATFTGSNNIVQFLRDDFVTGQNESSSGVLKRIRTYDNALTAGQVRDLFGGGVPPGLAVPEPSTFLSAALALVVTGLIRRQRRPV